MLVMYLFAYGVVVACLLIHVVYRYRELVIVVISSAKEE